MIVLVHGPDAATAQTEVSALVRTHDPDDRGTTRLDGRTIAISQLAAMVGTPGFFGETRVIVVDDLIARASKAKGGDDEDSDTAGAGAGKLELGPLFAAALPENLLILVDATLSSIPAAIRKAVPADVRIIAGDPPRGKPLLDAMQRIAKEAGSELSPAIAKELAEQLFPQTWAAKPSNPRYDRPPDLAHIRNEVEKLALSAHPGPIERRHLDEMSEMAHVDRLFPFLEAVVGGSVGRAVSELRALQEAGEDGHRLTAQLYQQVELAAVQDGARGRVDPVEVGRAIGLPNPNRMIGIARARRAAPSSAAIAEARAFDLKFKTGELRDPIDVLYGMTSAIAGASQSPARQRSG